MKKRILLSAAVTLGIAAAVMAMNIAGSVDLKRISRKRLIFLKNR